MTTSFLEFVNKKRNTNNILHESFDENVIQDALTLVNKVLYKHIDKLLPLDGFVMSKIDDDVFYSKQYVVYGTAPTMFQINFLNSGSSFDVYSIDFFDNLDYLFNYSAKSKLSLYTLGSSIVYFLPIIWTVVSLKNYNLTEKEAIDLGRSIFKNNKIKESKYYVGALQYHILEDLSNETIKEIFLMEDKNVNDFKKKKYTQAHTAYLNRKNSEKDKQNFKDLNAEYNEIRLAIAGGASTLEELKVALKHNVKIVAEIDEEIKKLETEFNEQKEERESPEQVFKKMNGYVKIVIKGLNPSVIICGAPGVGKTYKIKQLLKANNYFEGHNLYTIKGKCTPRRLYLALYEYKDKGDIIVIDDADSLVGPNAPEDCINILKGALDSTSDDEGRLVSYGVSGQILDDEGMEIPKRFYYNGSIIIITNWNAGKLDTALRGRSYIQDISFTTEEILKIIKNLMPALDPQHLTQESKNKAYDYLIELSKGNNQMEVSIRTFNICAKIFEACSNEADFTDDDAKSMIKEQMKLQSSRISGRGKGKY